MVGALFSFLIVTPLRMLYEARLRASRRGGRFARRLVLFGVTEHSADLIDLINDNPKSGYRIVGICGPAAQVAEHGRGLAWLGE